MNNNRIYSLILSFAVAFSLWLYVVNNVSQEDDRHFYNIPVVIEGESALAEDNLMITGWSSQTVSLHLSGTRSDLNKVNSGNIIVKVNAAKIEGAGENIRLTYSISFPDGVANDAFVVEDKNPANIYVDVDYRRQKEVPVEIRWTGTRSEDYIYDTESAVLDYPTVTVTGPAAVADLVDHAKIEIDLTKRVKSISDTFNYILCDAQGEPVNGKKQLSTNVEEIRVEVPIQRIRDVELRADIVYGGGANENNTTVTIEPASLQLSGGEALLEELGDVYTVATIQLAELEKSVTEQVYTLALPEGITNQTGVNEVKITVKLSGLMTKEFVVENFRMVNVPEGMTAEIINASLTVKVRGSAEAIGSLTAEDITAVVDFSEAEPGTATYKASIVFAEEFSGVGALKSSSVSATVQEAEEE